MGLVVSAEDLPLLQKIAERERAPREGAEAVLRGVLPQRVSRVQVRQGAAHIRKAGRVAFQVSFSTV